LHARRACKTKNHHKYPKGSRGTPASFKKTAQTRMTTAKKSTAGGSGRAQNRTKRQKIRRQLKTPGSPRSSKGSKRECQGMHFWGQRNKKDWHPDESNERFEREMLLSSSGGASSSANDGSIKRGGGEGTWGPPKGRWCPVQESPGRGLGLPKELKEGKSTR